MLRVEARARLGALDLDVALETPPGGCLALAGPSGAGKTSILRVVAGLLRPREGRVACGEEVWLDTARGIDVPPEERRCGYLFQEYALFGHLRVWQNVAYGLRDTPRGERRQRAHELLERFGVGELADARPRTLSGGERQRVALARAVARRPAALLGDRVGIVDRGRVIQAGTAGELAAAPASAFVADFTGATVLTGEAAPGADGLTQVALDGGGSVASVEPGHGRVAVSVYPWEVALAAPEAVPTGSAQNHVEAEVVSVTAVGNRIRVGMATPQPLVAEITGPSARELALEPGARVVATWKAAATRVLPL